MRIADDNRNPVLTVRNHRVTVLVLPSRPKSSSLVSGRGRNNEVPRLASPPPVRTGSNPTPWSWGSLRPKVLTSNHTYAQKFTGHMTGCSPSARATLLTKE
ncbi:hypothetical protein GCM10009602_01890 [Nocardiopsis tropica]